MGELATTGRSRGRTAVADDRRQLLIEATIRALGERGVEGATVRAICRTAGVSRGLLTHHYPNKDELLADALRQLFGRFYSAASRRLADDDDHVGRLMAVPDVLFAPRLCTVTMRNAYLAFWHETRFNPAVRQANRRLYVDYWTRVEELFAKAAAQRGVTIDSRRAASGLIAMIDGLWLELAIDVGGITRKESIAHCRDFIERRLAAP